MLVRDRWREQMNKKLSHMLIPKRPLRGMSLLEILIAYGILAIAVLGLLGGLPAAARQQRASIRMNQALYLAESKMDEVLGAGQRISQVVQSDQPLSDDSMVREWWGKIITTNTDLQLITVQVTWLEAGRSRQVVVRSYVPV